MLPKIIHFIWAGGEKLLPEINANRIKDWAIKNPDFKTYLWIDKKTTSASILQEYYHRYKFHEAPVILLNDIGEGMVEDEYSRYYIDKLNPNYGASSDLLRYSILIRYGGAYFDSDVIVDESVKPLNYAGLFDSNETAILRLNHLTQKHHAIGNDAMICTPQHPFMIDVYEQAKKNHCVQLVHSSPYEFDRFHNTINRTICATGPLLITSVCLKHDLLEKADVKGNDQVERVYEDGVHYYQRTKDPVLKLDQACYKPAITNDKNWLMSMSRKCQHLDDAISITLQSINFEIKYLGILRIDDHINLIVRAMDWQSSIDELKNESKSDPTENEINVANRLIQQLINFPVKLDHCQLIQLVTRFQVVADFYRKFTPGLHDGNANKSTKAITDATAMVSGEMRQSINSNYFSHVYNQVKELSTQDSSFTKNTPCWQLAKAHMTNLIEDYLRRGCDLSKYKDNLFCLKKIGLLSKDSEWFVTLFDTLLTIVRTVYEGSIKFVPKFQLSLCQAINEHLIQDPGDKDTIAFALDILRRDKMHFLDKQVILNEKIAVILDNLYAQLINKRRNQKFTPIHPAIADSYSPTLFQQAPVNVSLISANDNAHKHKAINH